MIVPQINSNFLDASISSPTNRSNMEKWKFIIIYQKSIADFIQFEATIWQSTTHIGNGTNSWKLKQMQPMRLCLFLGKQFEDTFENTQWRKAKQMQPM